jgi:hypothetical protein
MCDNSDGWDARERSASFPGPLASVMEGPWTLVSGAGDSAAVGRLLAVAACRIANHALFRGLATVPILTPSEVVYGLADAQVGCDRQRCSTSDR